MRELVSRCSICNTYQPRQSKEPLISHETPALPWSKVGVDLFVFENRTYLITVDYYSNFFKVDYLTSTTATAVIKKLKEQFSCHGIPETVFTDNVLSLSVENLESSRENGNFNILCRPLCIPSQMERLKTKLLIANY